MGRVAETGEPLIIDDYHTWEEAHPSTPMSTPSWLRRSRLVAGWLASLQRPPPTRTGSLIRRPASAHPLRPTGGHCRRQAWLFEQAQREIAERERAEAELRESRNTSRNGWRNAPPSFGKARNATEPLRRRSGGALPVHARGGDDGRQSGPGGDAGLPEPEAPGAIRPMSMWITRAHALAGPMEREGSCAILRPGSALRRYRHLGQRHRPSGQGQRGQVLYYEGSLEDITERKSAEAKLRKYQEHLEELVEERTAELRESEERYRTLFDGVPVGLYRTTPGGKPSTKSGRGPDAGLRGPGGSSWPSRLMTCT